MRVAAGGDARPAHRPHAGAGPQATSSATRSSPPRRPWSTAWSTRCSTTQGGRAATGADAPTWRTPDRRRRRGNRRRSRAAAGVPSRARHEPVDQAGQREGEAPAWHASVTAATCSSARSAERARSRSRSSSPAPGSTSATSASTSATRSSRRSSPRASDLKWDELPKPSEICEFLDAVRHRPGRRQEGARGRGLQPLQAGPGRRAGAARPGRRRSSWPSPTSC